MTISLVVGVDGSESSLEAVDWAADEAIRHGVPLHLLHAAAGGREASDVISAATARAREGSPKVRLSSEVTHEDAASALVGTGRNAFALVLGSRGLGDLAELLLGTVSLAVAARADCPVVVVRGAVEYRAAGYGRIVVGVEEEKSSGTAVQFALREAQVRRCRLVEYTPGTRRSVRSRRLKPRRGPWRPTGARRLRYSTTPCSARPKSTAKPW